MSDEAAIRPRRLRPGDVVSVVSPSWGGPHAFPHVHEHGLATLRGWGLEIREFRSTRASPAELRADPRWRADDLNAAFADPSVRGIIASIGGDDSIRLLPFLDAAVIRANPKILMGYSDTTTLLAAVRSMGLVTLHGPSVMAGLSQVAGLPQDYADHVRTMLFEAADAYSYPAFDWYVEGYPDWRDPANVGLSNTPRPHDGWRILQGSGRVEGELFGGCLEVLDRLRGTVALPTGDGWAGRLLFIEPSEEKPPPSQVELMLRSFGVMGVFDRIAGLLVGRPRDHSVDERDAFERVVRDVVSVEFGRPDLPIVAGLPFGHTDPQWVLPLGVRAALDLETRTFRLTEPWLS